MGILLGGMLGGRLKKLLMQGEQVVDHATGLPGQVLVATDRRAIIIKNGATLFSINDYSYPYAHITAVDVHQTMMGNSWVEIGTAGTPIKKRGFFGHIHGNNVILFSWVTGTGVKRVAGVIQQRILQGTLPQAVPQTAPSIPDQIAALAKLRDNGAITEDEYQRKKNELLARM